jgi:palmitoyltransferase ZDHHC13/17
MSAKTSTHSFSNNPDGESAQAISITQNDNKKNNKNNKNDDIEEEKGEKEWDVWRAAAYGNLEKLKQFLEEDNYEKIDAKDSNGFRALQWAALNNRVQIAEYLLDRGAEVNACDDEKQTALHWAAVRGALPVAELLLRRRAKMHAQDCRGYTCAHVAAQYGHASMLYHFLMRWDLDVNCMDEDRRCPLHWGAYKGFKDVVKLLLAFDADVMRADREGCTALHWAAIRGKAEAAHILALCGGEDILKSRDADGNTPAQLAMEKGHKSLSNMLTNQLLTNQEGKTWWSRNGMAAGCLAIVLGLTLMFVNNIVVGPIGTTSPDVAVAAWSWMVVLFALIGLVFFWRVANSDPGFVSTRAQLAAARKKNSLINNNDIEKGGVIISSSNNNNNNSDKNNNNNNNKEELKWLDHPELWAGNWERLCVTCKIVKPAGTKHCQVAKRCVRRFDHYCPWMGNTIGAKNHRDFVIFLLLETAAMIIALIVAVFRIWEESPTEKQASKTGVLFFVAGDLSVLIPVLLLSGSQLAQVARNITTNELMNLHRYTYLRNSDGTFHNPFDRGVFKNFVAFFFVDPSRRLREFEEKADFRVSNNINVSTTDALV